MNDIQALSGKSGLDAVYNTLESKFPQICCREPIVSVQEARLCLAIVLVLVHALTWNSCSTHKVRKSMLHIDGTFNGREIAVAELDTLELSLPENPTTGYRWQRRSNGEPICKFVSAEFEAPSGGVGRGGTLHLRYQVVGKGVATIKLAYERVFEPNKVPVKTFELTIRSNE